MYDSSVESAAGFRCTRSAETIRRAHLMSSTVQLGLSTQQCGHLCRHALWLPPYDLGLEADSGMSKATVDERKLISKFRARQSVRLGLGYKSLHTIEA